MTDSNITKGLGILMAVLLLAVLIWPLRNEMNRQYDTRTSSDLDSISDSVDEYFSTNSELPDSLDELQLDSELERRVDERGYEYNSGTLGEYELCANFKTESSTGTQSIGALDSFAPDRGSDTSIHDKGRTCFDLEVSYFGSFQQDQSPEFENMPFELDDLESQLDGLEGLENLLTPENLETLDTFEL